jgi:hypothetical protein
MLDLLTTAPFGAALGFTSSFDGLLAAAGVEIREFDQGFNAYAAPRRLKGLIHLVNRIVIESRTLSTEGYSFPFFLSDLILLRKT